MQLHLYGVIALGLLITGAVVSGGLGQEQLSLILAGAAAGGLIPQLFRPKA